jgi:hypothetical protein
VRQQTKKRPFLDTGGVATETTEGGDTPITIDEHQPLAASAGTAGNRHHMSAELEKLGRDIAVPAVSPAAWRDRDPVERVGPRHRNVAASG